MVPRRLKQKCSAISEINTFSKKEAKETDGIQNKVMNQKEEEAPGRLWDHLPHEVVVEILLRLPVKSLVRFKCVCKGWYSLISGDAFITTHASQAVSQSHDKSVSGLVVFGYGIRFYDRKVSREHFLSLRSDDDNFIDLNFPRYVPICHPRRYVKGSCNGLLCTASFSDDYKRWNFELWNPSIRRALRLPEPNLNCSTVGTSFFGLGYSPSSGDIKFVRLVYLPHKSGPYIPVTPQVEIYTLKSGCWRCITTPIPQYKCSSKKILSVFVNGACHWIGYTSPNSRNLIMAFDMVDEVFREIPLPTCIVGINCCNSMTLHLREGLLCLAFYHPLEEQYSLSVWIMKEYGVQKSWTKLFEIHMHEGFWKLVGFRKRGQVLFCDRGRNDLLSYEPNTQQVTRMRFHPHSTKHYYLHVENEDYLWEKYVETMFLLNVENGVSK